MVKAEKTYNKNTISNKTVVRMKQKVVNSYNSKLLLITLVNN